MKKIALFCAVVGVAFGVMADSDGLKFKFSSAGDTYADGSAVQDGEVYALIWVKTGASFAGFNADGTLVDAANNDLAAVSVAQGGGCVKTVFVVEEKQDAGTYSMYLLDTRLTVADADGNVSKKAAGLTDGKITAVNMALAVTGASFEVASSDSVTVDGVAVAAAGDAKAAAPVDESKINPPVVTGFVLDADGGATLTVGGTVPYVQYTVYGGATPNGIDTTKALATFLNGSAGGTLVLKVANVGANSFFKVFTK